MSILYCCSLQTWSSDVVVLAPSCTGCGLFLPCRNLLVRSPVQNATFNSNKPAQNSAHTQTRVAHKPSDHEVVRAKQRTQKCTQHSVANAQHWKIDDGNKREKRYNCKYPSHAAAAVLASNETHWYMLPIILIVPTILHSKCLLARSLSLARTS